MEDTIAYQDLQELFHTHLPRDLHTYREYHGLLVYTAKEFCKTKANCEGCPLAELL